MDLCPQDKSLPHKTNDVLYFHINEGARQPELADVKNNTINVITRDVHNLVIQPGGAGAAAPPAANVLEIDLLRKRGRRNNWTVFRLAGTARSHQAVLAHKSMKVSPPASRYFMAYRRGQWR